MDTGWRLVQEMFFVDVDTLHEIDISSVSSVISYIYLKFMYYVMSAIFYFILLEMKRNMILIMINDFIFIDCSKVI